MKLLVICLFATMTLHCAAEDQERRSVTITPVLAKGFGEMIEIEGRIVDITDTRRKGHLGKKLIEVRRVGTEELKQPVVIELLVFPWTDIEIPERGTEVRFRGYESGGFTGIPNEAFKDIESVSTTDHHFQSRFYVTKQLK